MPGHDRPPSPNPPGWTVVAAEGAASRMRGLLGRRSLGPAEGLWLRARSVHTVGMRMRLDLVWLDATATPVRTDRDVGPGRIRTCLAARGGVVEVEAGRGPALAAALASGAGPGLPSVSGGAGPDAAGRPSPKAYSSSRSSARLREPR